MNFMASSEPVPVSSEAILEFLKSAGQITFISIAGLFLVVFLIILGQYFIEQQRLR